MILGGMSLAMVEADAMSTAMNAKS